MKLQNGLIAEFEHQSYTQIIFPHAKTDWAGYLQEAQETFINIINAIQKYQTCKIICYDIDEVKKHFSTLENLLFVQYETNDTWARDCSALCVVRENKKELLNFTFTAWGGKFDAKKDNAMTAFLSPNAISHNFILEGGGIESNGAGIILTTADCMLNKNRNFQLSREQITHKLQKFFVADTILYLEHGYLAGDDTDSHIDTLARFISQDTIMYIECRDKNDEHYTQLALMQRELMEMAQTHNLKLIALPMSDAIYYKEERLPATYANFLFLNGAILLPVYGVNSDALAVSIFQKTFPHLDIIKIDCSVLIRQHGSLHCVTMNFAF